MRVQVFAVTSKKRISVYNTAWFADLVRRSVMSQYGKLYAGSGSETFSGKDQAGLPLKGHMHAIYLPLDNDGDGLIDLIAICSKTDFTAAEILACQTVQTLNYSRQTPVIEVVWQKEGAIADFTAVEALQSSASWRSVTPFVLGRFPKFYRSGERKMAASGLQIDGPEYQLRKEWEIRREVDPVLPEILRVLCLPACDKKGKVIPWDRFERRSKKAAPGLALGFTVHFSSSVSGPIALGQGAHFGLGLFQPY